MNAPISEVPPHAPKKRDFAKAPLRSLSVLCTLQAFATLSSFFVHTPDPELGLSRFWDWTIEGIVTVLSLLLTYFLWRGSRWARGIWLWTSVLSSPFYFFFWDEIFKGSQTEQFSLYLELVLGLLLLIYLNLPAVKAHFAQRKMQGEALQ